MTWQKGPGEGYMAAKKEVLAICPSAVCYRVTGWGCVTGYVVYRDKNAKTGIGSGTNARDAWNNALDKLKRKSS